MTQLAYTFRGALGFEQPGRFLHPKGYGTLGYALPAAIGAKIAEPDCPALIVMGDGGLMFTLGEMATAADEGSNVIMLLWNNESLAAIRDEFAELGIRPIGVSPKPPDFQGLARALGWNARRAKSADSLRDSLDIALTADRPTLIELRESDPF